MFSSISISSSLCICLALVAVIIVISCTPSNGQTCTQQGDCACKMSDGSGTIDISSLGNTNGNPRFPYTKPSPLLPWEFAFNPCYDFSDAHCTNVVSCQKNSDDATANFPLGTADSAVWATDGTSVQYQSTAQGVIRTSVLKLVCDLKATSPKFEALGEDIPSSTYDYTLTSNCACPDGCKSGGGSSGGISAGSVICILFSVVVVVYLVGGGLYMKFGRGAEGKEIIPNSTFWFDFHNYVKDGFLFLTSLCKKSEYSDI